MRSFSTRAAGLLVLLGGLWGGLAPFVGPYWHFTLGPDKTWTWTTGRLWLDILPGAVAVVAGLMLIGAGPRPRARLGALLGLAAGIWFTVGPAISELWTRGGAQGVGHGSAHARMLENLTFHTGLGVLMAAVAAYILPRFPAHLRAAEGVAAGDGVAADRRTAADRDLAAERGYRAEPGGRPTRGLAAERDLAAERGAAGERDLAAERGVASRARGADPAATGAPAGHDTAVRDGGAARRDGVTEAPAGASGDPVPAGGSGGMTPVTEGPAAASGEGASASDAGADAGPGPIADRRETVRRRRGGLLGALTRR